MKVKRTSRGFDIAEFKDANGEECSVQQSSAAGDHGLDHPGSSFLWLGCQYAKPKIMASQAKRLGVETNETTGWIPFPVPEDVQFTTRMHLNREQVAELMQVLQRWLHTGSLSGE